MGLFDALRPMPRNIEASARQEADLASSMWTPTRAAHVTTASDISGLIGSWMSVDAAMQVPSFARGLNLITGIAAGFPLRSYSNHVPRLLLSGGMAERSSDAALVAGTVADMVCHGRAAWKFDGARSRVRRLRHDAVTPRRSEWFADADAWEVGGRIDPDVLVFDTGSDGCLDAGWATIRTALNLEAAASNIASTPMPTTVLKSTGLDLDDADAAELLGAWESSRRTRSTAYLSSSVDLQAIGFDAAQMQLVEARQHTALEVARLLNLDPYWVGAGVAGSSLTYQNRQELNQSLLDLTIFPLLRVIEQSLSGFLSEGTTRHVLRFDTTGFTRADLAQRVAALTSYLTAGLLSVEECRALEPLVTDFGRTPE